MTTEQQLREALTAIVEFCDDPHGSEKPESLASGMARLLVPARIAVALPSQRPLTTLWLWKNFVDGKPEYWAFDNPYPAESLHGDGLTLGEPCGYAIFKPSVNGRPDRSIEYVLDQIKRASQRPDDEGVDETLLADIFAKKIRYDFGSRYEHNTCLYTANNIIAAIRPYLRAKPARCKICGGLGKCAGAGKGVVVDNDKIVEALKRTGNFAMKSDSSFATAQAVSAICDGIVALLDKRAQGTALSATSPAPAVPAQTPTTRDNNSAGNGESMGCANSVTVRTLTPATDQPVECPHIWPGKRIGMRCDECSSKQGYVRLADLFVSATDPDLKAGCWDYAEIVVTRRDGIKLRRWTAEVSAYQPESKVPKHGLGSPTPTDWHPHHGGECPVSGELKWEEPYSSAIIPGAQYIMELVIPDEKNYFGAACYHPGEIGWNTRRGVVRVAYIDKSSHENDANKRAWEICNRLNALRIVKPGGGE